MFTGLVQEIGEVVAVDHHARSSRITIGVPAGLPEVTLGESIAVNGACFTVVAFGATEFSIDVSPESRDKTTAGALRRGEKVHLERAMRLSDRLGGHLVLGHIDGVGRLRSCRADANAWHLRFDAPPAVARYLIPKGCIAVDGVSLTVNGCDEGGFDVTLVPHTGERTLLLALSAGDSVNLEADIVGKYVARLLPGHQSTGDLTETLQRAGFLGPEHGDG